MNTHINKTKPETKMINTRTIPTPRNVTILILTLKCHLMTDRSVRKKIPRSFYHTDNANISSDPISTFSYLNEIKSLLKNFC